MSALPAYRRDIDGLRALAILPVVLFHTHVPGLSGGYVGVDVFFVISGYLIAGILTREIDRGSFSIVRFYERRARRILPALLVVLAVVLAVASWLYLPGDFENVPRSALMVVLFLSNIWFYSHTDYFAPSADTQPLLHCWSLAVEEQFYLVFPLLLFWCARFSRRLQLATVLGLAVLSLVWAAAKQDAPDGFAFYMLPPRAWELLVGALLAMGLIPEARRESILSEGLALFGLMLIGGAVVYYDRNTTFPGLSALPPVLGAGLLLHYAPGTIAGRILSMPLLVGVGLVSYSLYLWHWPLIVFSEYVSGESLTGGTAIIVVSAAFFAAWMSWRFIESPFRNSRRYTGRIIFQLSASGMALVAGASSVLVLLGGWSARFSPDVVRYTSARFDYSPARFTCLTPAVGGDRPGCTLGAAVPPNTILWGDSHGVELSWVISQELSRQHQSLMERTRGSCPPVIGYTNPKDTGCAEFNREVLRRILTTPSLETVYLAAFWASPVYNQPGMSKKLNDTINQLLAGGKSITVIGPVPEQPFEVPRRLSWAAAYNRPYMVRGVGLEDYRKATDWFTVNYGTWRAKGISVVDPLSVFLTGGFTRLTLNGRSLYFDSHHLSLTGAREVVKMIPNLRAPDIGSVQ